MTERNTAGNYGRPTELESVKVTDLSGRIMTPTHMVGSADTSLTSSVISSIRVTTNLNLAKGMLRLQIVYHSVVGVYIVDCSFMEFGDSLVSVLNSYEGTKEPNRYNIKWAGKKINNNWEILVKRNTEDVNNFSISYSANDPDLSRYSDPTETSFVDFANSSIFSDGTLDSNITYQTFNKAGSIIPGGTICAWYPDISNTLAMTDPYTWIKENMPGWVLCDEKGTYTNQINVTKSVPDLRGKFIMGFGKTGLAIEVPGNMSGTSLIPTESSTLMAYNSDQYRTTSNSQATEGIAYNTTQVNCGKIGNVGGTYVTKSLPKQQGSLAIALKYGKGDNTKTSYAPAHGLAFYWSSPSSWFTYLQNGTSPGQNSRPTSNLQGYVDAESVGGFNWKPGAAYLAEGASPHENKPPYIVMAYIMKMHE